jgi:hypothetical protein
MEACLGKTETTYLGANPEEMESDAVHEEVSKEEAAMKIVRALKKRYEDRHLTIMRHGQAKKRTQGDGGSRKKLTAACRCAEG